MSYERFSFCHLGPRQNFIGKALSGSLEADFASPHAHMEAWNEWFHSGSITDVEKAHLTSSNLYPSARCANY